MKPRMSTPSSLSGIRQIFAVIALFSLLFWQSAAPAQQQTPQNQQQQNQSNQQNQQGQQQQDQAAPEAGGPGADTGAIAIPKKKEAETPPPPPPEPKVKNPPGLQNFSLRVDVPVVNVDVGVNLEKDNFRVYEDGVEQNITNFQRIQAPITAVLLVEFAANSWWFIQDMENAAYTFAQQLKPDDYIAVVTYDMHTTILTDFTQDKRLIYQSLNSLTIPTWHETNLFDALYTTLDRLSRVDGRKYIILISSGRDTFSKINLDKVLQKIKATPNVTIFSVGTGQTARIMADSAGMMGPVRNLDYL